MTKKIAPFTYTCQKKVLHLINRSIYALKRKIQNFYILDFNLEKKTLFIQNCQIKENKINV